MKILEIGPPGGQTLHKERATSGGRGGGSALTLISDNEREKKMKGRKPKPARLKILCGRVGEQKKAVPPAPDPAIPECPEHLSDLARGEWQRLAAELYALGLLTKLDRAALAAACVCWARWVESEQQMTETGGAVIKSPNGYPIQNPYLSIANEALRQLKGYLIELGLTPGSRGRIDLKPLEAQSKLAKFTRR